MIENSYLINIDSKNSAVNKLVKSAKSIKSELKKLISLKYLYL